MTLKLLRGYTILSRDGMVKGDILVAGNTIVSIQEVIAIDPLLVLLTLQIRLPSED